MPRTDLYNLLGVPRDASMQAIRGAYRSLAKQLHPDTNPSADAAAKFAQVAKAYEVLGDSARRREYDAKLNCRSRGGDATGTSVSQGHYAWVNIAGARGGAPADVSEFDELYDTFFGVRPNGADGPAPGKTPVRKKRSRKA